MVTTPAGVVYSNTVTATPLAITASLTGSTVPQTAFNIGDSVSLNITNTLGSPGTISILNEYTYLDQVTYNGIPLTSQTQVLLKASVNVFDSTTYFVQFTVGGVYQFGSVSFTVT